MSKDYYKILGLTKTATQSDIKKAYRQLAMENHPDKHPQDKAKYEAKFKEINEAYAILSDESKRAQYDQFGNADFNFGGGGSQGFGNGGFGFDFGNIHDIFDTFFNDSSQQRGGGRRRAQSKRNGSDLRYTLEITLEEAYFGTKKTIEFRALDKCDSCNGTGSADKKIAETECQTCKGRGAVRMQQGFFIVEQECHKCGGTGTTIANPCKSCNGSGRKEKVRKVDVSIPAGIEHGANLRMENFGEAGERGANFGDLYVVVNVKQHQYFKRVGANLHCDIPISFTKAALGGEVKTISVNKKEVVFDIAKGTQTGQQFVIKGEGMPMIGRGKNGDIVATVHIETPVKLTKEQEDILKKFEETIDKNSHPKSHGFFDTIRGIFS